MRWGIQSVVATAAPALPFHGWCLIGAHSTCRSAMEDRGLLQWMEEPLLAESSSSDDDIIFENVMRRRRPKFNPRIDHFLYEEEDFRARFRMSRALVQALVELLDPQLRRPTRRHHALTTAQQVLLTLQFYATGTFQRCVGDMSGLHKSTVCRTVHVVSRVIARLRPNYITMPTGPMQMNNIVEKFFEVSSFPKVLGAIDCTHVPLESPGGDNGEYYRNRKDSFSINVQAVVDSNLYIRNIVARWPGSAHDSNIFNNSNIKGRLEAGEFPGVWILGDKGYALKPYLLTPLAAPRTDAERLYNESHARTRNVVERTFGVWKRRFPAIGTKLRVNIDRVQAIIVATAVLHNICREASDIDPPDAGIELELEIGVEDVQEQPMPVDEANRLTLINEYFTRLR